MSTMKNEEARAGRGPGSRATSHGLPIVRAIDSADVPPCTPRHAYVYAFDHKHRRPPMEYKDLLGGKGANLAEMTSVLEAAGAAGLHDLHRRLPGLHARRLAGRARRRDRRAGRQAREDDGPQARRPADPLLVSVRSGAKFSMPGMMDTVLNLGLNDKSVKGLAAVTGDERFAYDSYRRFISMYGRIVLDVDGEHVRAPARGRPRATPA